MGDVAQILGIQPNQQAYGMTHSRSGSSQPAAAATTTTTTNAAATASSSVLSSHTPFTQPVLRMVASVKSSAEESSAPLPPMAPSLVRVNQKYISTKKKARPWCWAPFASEARNDGLLLHHWVRAGVEYPEYPFARFNIHLDALDYRRGEEDEEDEDGNEFYKEFLQDDHWTKSETDALLDLCRIYELRWPVIIDRWIGKYGSLSNKKVEDLQHRYYTIGMILNRKLVEKAAKLEAENMAKALAASQSSRAGVVGSGGGTLSSGTVVGNVSAGMGAIQDSIGEVMSNKNDPETDLRMQHAVISEIATSSSTAISSMIGNVHASMQPPIQATNTGTSNQPPFDLEAERQRRRVLEKIWNRSKEEELEEESLRAELKLVEAQIRKLKKSGGHILAAAAGGVVPGSTGPTPASSRGPSPVPGSVSAAGMVGAAGGAGVGGASVAGGGVDASFALLDAQFTATAPVPTPGIPYLQSGRLVNPATGGQMSISKASLKRMEQILKELKVNDRPLPTKRVCDMYDHVRKGALTLLTLQKAILKKESEVMTRRKKLEKIAGAAVAREIQIKAEAAKAAAAAAAEKERIAAEKAKAKEKAKEVATKKQQVAPKKTATKKRPPAKKGTKQKPASKKSNTPKSTPGDAATTPSANTNIKASAAKSLPSKTSTSKAPNAKAATTKTTTAKNSTSKASSTKTSTAKAVMPVPPNLTPPSTAPPPNDNDDMTNPKKRAKIS